MNRGDRLNGLLRFGRIQVSARIARSPLLWSWIEGTKLIIHPGESGLTQNAYCGLHEHVEMLFMLHVLRPDDLFIDIGANVGSYTVLASGVVGCQSISFEPVPMTFDRLGDNIALNRLGSKVKMYQMAPGDAVGKVQITLDENCTNHIRSNAESADASTAEVPIQVLDQVVRGMSPCLLKIDVEGYETLVIRGAEESLANESLRVVIMELNGSGSRYNFDELEIVEKMKSRGFATATYDPFNRQIVLLDGKCLSSGNTLFVRDLPWLQDRVANAPKRGINRQHV